MAPITAPAGARCNQNQTCRHRVHDATSGLEKKDASACSVRLPQDHVLTITRRTGLLSHAVISPCRIQYPVVCLPATIGASKPDHRWSGTLRISIEPFFQGKSYNYKVRQAFDPAIDCFLQVSSVIFISSFPLTGSNCLPLWTVRTSRRPSAIQTPVSTHIYSIIPPDLEASRHRHLAIDCWLQAPLNLALDTKDSMKMNTWENTALEVSWTRL